MGEAALKKPPALALDVIQSVSGKRWLLTDTDERRALGMAQKLGLPEVVARLLTMRGVDVEDAESFLTPTLKDLLPDPGRFKDMDKAVDRILRALGNNEKITVFGDYDVDGATSSALLKRFFRAIGVDVGVFIPDRIEDGYGPNSDVFRALKEQGTDLIITVDCGVLAFEPLDTAAEIGLDVIVLDHHEAQPDLPKAAAIVNPNRVDEDKKYHYLAAVGVTFMTIVALNRALRNSGYYKNREEPDLTQWLDLVALGTVCDVVPLVGVNRALVIQGLRIMARRKNAGLSALCDIAAVTEAPTAFHLGFILGPRVNAGGRVGRADAGSRLLCCDDPLEAAAIARELHAWNNERKTIESGVQKEAEKLAEEQNQYAIVVAGEGWHPGVIGIVASRLKEKYSRPACVISLANGIGKGSGRSVAGVDLGAIIIAARQKGLLTDGGGHEMAAGFTVPQDQLESFTTFLNERIGRQLNGEPLLPSLRVDGVLSPSALTMDLATKLEQMAPFGAGNAQPRFALAGARIARPEIVGDSHIRCFVSDTAGGGGLKAIAFRCVGTPLGDALLSIGRAPVNLAGQIRINRWNGYEKVEFQIDDLAGSW